jgi:hypothetical protein
MHAYSIFILWDTARMLWWDRLGTIVTEAFKYNEEKFLIEFFPSFLAIDVRTSSRPWACHLQASHWEYYSQGLPDIRRASLAGHMHTFQQSPFSWRSASVTS